jgi:hypothetical protein
MRRLLSTFIVVFALTLGCQSSPESNETEQPPVEEEPRDEGEETMDEESEKVNENNKLEDVRPEAEADGCPPPEDSGQMCAQVIVWALSPDGKCCEYPTPCHAPKDWETYHSADECDEAAGDQDESDDVEPAED